MHLLGATTNPTGELPWVAGASLFAGAGVPLVVSYCAVRRPPATGRNIGYLTGVSAERVVCCRLAPWPGA